MLYIFLMCVFNFWNSCGFWYVPHTLAFAKFKASSKIASKKMLTIRRNIRLTIHASLLLDWAILKLTWEITGSRPPWWSFYSQISRERAGSAFHQILKRSVGYRSHYNLPPLCWKTEKRETSPVSRMNIICLGCWALVSSKVSKPQVSMLPSGLFHKATCTLEEIPASAQANTNLVCLLQLGIVKLHRTSSRMKREDKKAQLRIKLL